jgi:PAS domain S-box-containing protein
VFEAVLLEHAPDAIVVVDDGGVVHEWNLAAERLFGFERAEAVGHGLGMLIAPQRLRSARLSGVIRTLATGGAPPRTPIEVSALHKDGSRLSVDVSVATSTETGLRLWIAVIRDRSARRRSSSMDDQPAESTPIRASGAAVGSWDWDLSQPRARWSGAMCSIFGRPPGFAPTEEEFLELVHPDDRERVSQAIHSLPPSDQTGTTYRIIRADGEVRDVYTHREARIDEHGVLSYASGTVLDITELRIAREAQYEARELFETAFADAPNGIALVGLDGRFIRVNQAMCEITGYAAAELADSTFGGITLGTGLSIRGAQIEALARDEAPSFETEMRYVKPTGEEIWVTLMLSMPATSRARPSTSSRM